MPPLPQGRFCSQCPLLPVSNFGTWCKILQIPAATGRWLSSIRTNRRGLMAKKKNRVKKRTQRRRKNNRSIWLWAIIGLVISVVVVWLGYQGFQDRHWQAFIESGDRAFARGNYSYAERMYKKALQQARELDPGGNLEKQTSFYLNRTYRAQLRPELTRVTLQ